MVWSVTVILYLYAPTFLADCSKEGCATLELLRYPIISDSSDVEGVENDVAVGSEEIPMASHDMVPIFPGSPILTASPPAHQVSSSPAETCAPVGGVIDFS